MNKKNLIFANFYNTMPVDYLKTYSIPVNSLEEGVHEFDFQIDELFFKQFEYTEVISGQLQVHVQCEKRTHLMDLQINISGTIRLVCDRCLEEFDEPIDINNQLIVKLGDSFLEESADVIIIAATDEELNIAKFIFEYIELSIPITKSHPYDENDMPTCNPEVLAKLEQYTKHTKPENFTDPRWEMLKNIKFN